MEKQKKIKRCASDRVLITIFYILVAIFAIVCPIRCYSRSEPLSRMKPP